MNGHIAPLLALMMTGMVFSQQPQSLTPNPGTAGAELLNGYHLIMEPNVLQGLRANGSLVADMRADLGFEKYREIDHIVIYGSEQQRNRSDIELTDVYRVPTTDDDQTLEFLLSETELGMLNRKGLRYIILASERGKYQNVKVTYERPAALPRDFAAGSTTNVPSNQFGNAAGMPSRQTPENRPVFGPALPDDNAWQQSRQSTIAPSVANNTSNAFNPRIGTIAQRRDRVADSNRWSPPSTTGFARDTTPFPSQPQINSNPSLTNSVRPLSPQVDDLTTIEQSNAAIREELRLREAQRKELERLKQQRLVDENFRLRQELNDERQLQTERAREWEQSQALAARTNPRPNQSFSDLPVSRVPNRHTQYYDDRPVVSVRSRGQNEYVGMPDRMAANRQPTSKPQPLSIAGPQSSDESVGLPAGDAPLSQVGQTELLAKQKRLERYNNAVTLIMFCAIGLNLYLAWIARGFYVRYEELADEIRETFTNSM